MNSWPLAKLSPATGQMAHHLVTLRLLMMHKRTGGGVDLFEH
jgi:hypothetical protein